MATLRRNLHPSSGARELTWLTATLTLACSSTVRVDETASGGAPPSNTASSSSTGGDDQASSGTTAATTGPTTSTGAGGQPICEDHVEPASYAHDPVDAIVVVSNASSMGMEIQALEPALHDHLVQPLQAAAIDTRVVMLTEHGSSSSSPQPVCIPPPLSATSDCTGPPIGVPDQFFHYSVPIGGHDTLCRVLDTFDGSQPDQYALSPSGWSAWLRGDALGVFIGWADDGTSCTHQGVLLDDGDDGDQGLAVALDVDDALLALSPAHFGTKADRRYVWHSIVGLAPKSPATPVEAYDPFAPVVLSTCTPGGQGPGTASQWLSKGTSGLRLPLCTPAAYDVVLQQIVVDTIARTRRPCELRISEAALAHPLFPEGIGVFYTPGGGGPQKFFDQARTTTDCAPGKVVHDGDRVILCPETCEEVMADPDPQLHILVSCGIL